MLFRSHETYVLEENLENTTSLLVDETRNTLHATTAGEATDSGLGDTLDVITKDLAVTLRAALAETLENVERMISTSLNAIVAEDRHSKQGN